MKLTLILFLVVTVSAVPFSFRYPNWFCNLALQVFHDVAPSQLAQASTYCSSFIRPTVYTVATTTSTSSAPGPTTTVSTDTLESTQTDTVVSTTSTTLADTFTSVVTSTVDLGLSITVTTVDTTVTSGTTYNKRELHEPTLVARGTPCPAVWSKLAAADKSAACSCVLQSQLPSPTTSYTSTKTLSTTRTGASTPVTSTTSSVTTVQSTSTSVTSIFVESTTTITTTISTYDATTTSTQTATVTVPSTCPTNPLGPDFSSWQMSTPYSGGSLPPGEWAVDAINGATYSVGSDSISVVLDGSQYQYVDIFYLGIDQVCPGQNFVVSLDATNTGVTYVDEFNLLFMWSTSTGTIVVEGDLTFNLPVGATTSAAFIVNGPDYSYTPQLGLQASILSNDAGTITLSGFQLTTY